MRNSFIIILMAAKYAIFIVLKIVLSRPLALTYLLVAGFLTGIALALCWMLVLWTFGVGSVRRELFALSAIVCAALAFACFLYVSLQSIQAAVKKHGLTLEEIASRSVISVRQLIDEGFELSKEERTRRK